MKNIMKNDIQWIKYILNSGVNDIPVFWLGGWPEILTDNIKYNNNIFYVDSHYNRKTEVPFSSYTTEEHCEYISNKIIEKLNYTSLIIGGFSIGAVHALETAKILQKKGIDIKLLLLLDPLDTILVKDNNISVLNSVKSTKLNNMMFFTGNVYSICRKTIYNIIWKFNKIIPNKYKNKIRRRCIYSIYNVYRRRYNFSKFNGNAIIIQRHNNISNSKFKWTHLFDKNKCVEYKLDYNQHFDFFSNEKCIKEWTFIFNKHLKH